MSIDKGHASAAEAAKLVQEIQHLIKVKNLNVDLVHRAGSPVSDENLAASGCTGCTICSCMICW